METMRIEEVPPIETIVETKNAIDFKGFEALHITILDINDRLLCSNVQTEARHMYDKLRRSFATFQRNVNKQTLPVCEM